MAASIPIDKRLATCSESQFSPHPKSSKLEISIFSKLFRNGILFTLFVLLAAWLQPQDARGQAATNLRIYNVNGDATQPQDIYHALPFSINFGTVNIGPPETPQNVSVNTMVGFRITTTGNQSLLNSYVDLSDQGMLYTTSHTIVAGSGVLGINKEMILLSNTDATLTARLEVFVKSGQALASASFLVRIHPTVGRLAFSTSAIGVVNPYDASGFTPPANAQESGVPFTIETQTLDLELFPSGLQTTTPTRFTVPPGIGVSFSTVATVTTQSFVLQPYVASAIYTTTMTLYYSGSTPIDFPFTMERTGGVNPLASTTTTMRLSPLPPDRFAFSATNANGNDGFNPPTNVTSFTVSASRSTSVSITIGTFNLLGATSATTAAATALLTLTPDAGGALTITPSTTALSTSTAVYPGNYTLDYTGIRRTSASLTVSGAGLNTTTQTLDVLVPPATELGLSTTGSGNFGGFNGGSSTVQLAGASSVVPVTVGTFDAGGTLTAFDGNNPALSSTTLIVSLAGVGGNDPRLNLLAGTLATITNFEAQIAHSVTIEWTGPVSTQATLTVSHTSGTLSATSLVITILPPPAERVAFSTTSSTGRDGLLPLSYDFTGTTQSVTVTVGTFNAIGNPTATSANVTAEILLDTGDGDVTVGTIALTTGTPFATTTLTVSFTGDVPTVADFTVRLPNNVLTETTATVLFVQPPARILAWSNNSTNGTTSTNGFNGGDLEVNSQQIINLNFASFAETGYRSATSASAFAAGYRTVTMRIVGSPFPSNPALKPTITGVGGVWSSGPAVTSTHAVVYLSSTASLRLGTIQFGWLGSFPTTMTLSLVSNGPGNVEGAGTLQSTTVTVTVYPLPPNHLAFSTTSSTGQDGFNPTDASGLGNRYRLQAIASANRTTAPITITTGTFNIIGALSATTATTQTDIEVFTGFNDASALPVGNYPIFTTSNTTTTNQFQISFTSHVARGANVTLSTTGAGVNLQSTTVTVTLLTPTATGLAFSATNGNTAGPAGAGLLADGFNGGDHTIILNASTATVPVTISSYDAFNYLTATGNNTFPIFFFTTTVTITLNSADPNLSLTSGSSATFSPLTATVTQNLGIKWTGVSSTTALLTAVHDGDGTMGSTSITVTIMPPEADRLLFTDNNFPGGFDGFNGGNLSLNLSPTTATVWVTAGTWNNIGNLRATEANVTANIVAVISGEPPLIIGSLPFTTTTAVASQLVTVTWAGTIATTAEISLVPTNGNLAITTLTVSLIPPVAVTTAFSAVQNASTGTTGFNGGLLEARAGETVSVTVGQYNAFNWLRATSNTFSANLAVYNTAGNFAPNAFAGPVFSGNVSTQAIVIPGEDNINGITAVTTASLIFEWRGQTPTTALIQVNAGPNLGSTRLSITVYPRPARYLSYSTTSTTNRTGLPASVQLTGTNAVITVTLATFNAIGDPVATTSNVQVFFIQSIPNPPVPQLFIGNTFMVTTSAVTEAPITPQMVFSGFGTWTGPRPTTAVISTIQFAPQSLVNTQANITLIPPVADRLALMTTTPTTIAECTALPLTLNAQNFLNFDRVTDANTQIVATSSYVGVTITTASAIALPNNEYTTGASLYFTYTESTSTTITVTLETVAPQSLASTSFTITVVSKPTKLDITSHPDPVYCEDSFPIHWRTLNDGNFPVPVIGDTEVRVTVSTSACVAGLAHPTVTTMTAGTLAASTLVTVNCCCTTPSLMTVTVEYLSGPNVLASTTTTVTIIPAPTKLVYQNSTTNVSNNEPFSVELATLTPKDLPMPVTTNTVVQFTILSPATVQVIDYISPGGPSAAYATGLTITGADGAPTVTFTPASATTTTTVTIRINDDKATMLAKTTVSVQVDVLSGASLSSTICVIELLPFEGFPNQGIVSRLRWLENSPAVTPVTTAGVAIVPAPKVAVNDVWGNLITNYIGPVDAQIGTNNSLCGLGSLASYSGTHTVPSAGVVRENIGVGAFGIATFTGLHIDKIGVGYGLEGTDPLGLMQTATSNSFEVIPDAPTQLAFYSQPPHVTTAGYTFDDMRADCPDGSLIENTGQDLVVEMQDQFGNLNKNFITQVQVSIDGFTPRVAGAPQGTLTIVPVSQFTNAGRATFAGISINKAGLYTLRAASGLLTDAISEEFEIEPDAVVSLNWIVEPSDVASGNIMVPAVEVEGLDQYGNRTTNSTVTIELTTTANFTPVNNMVALNYGVASFATLRTVGPPQTAQLLASTASISQGAVSAEFDILGGADRLAYSQTAAGGIDGFNVGDPSPLEVSSGQTALIDLGSFNALGTKTDVTTATVVQFSVSATVPPVSLTGSTQATLNQYTSELSTGLSFSYSGSLPTTAIITATAISGQTLSSTTITIQVGPPTPADRLALSTSPTAVVNPYDASGVESTALLSNRDIDVYFQVLNDQFLPTATTASTTVQFAILGSGGSPVPGLGFGTTNPNPIVLNTSKTLYKTTLNASWTGSVATTTAILRLAVSSVGQTLLSTQVTITVKPFTTATRLAFITQPSASNTAGVTFGTQPRVAVVDDYGNVVQNFTGTVTLSLGSDGSICGDGALNGTLARTIFPVDAGVASYTNLSMNRTGSYDIVATWQDNTLQPATSASFTINPAAPTKLAFYSQPPHVTTAGTPLNNNPLPWPCPSGVTTNIIVQLQDQYGNHNPNFDASVTLSIGAYTPNVAGAYSSSGTLSIGVTSGGQIQYSGIVLDRAGSYQLRAGAGAYTDALSEEFEVVPDALATMAFVQQPNTVACDESFVPAPSVELRDQYNNYVTTATVVTSSIHGGPASDGTLAGVTTATNGATTGVATFSGITAVHGTAGAGYYLEAQAGAVIATSANFTITTGAVYSVTFATLPSTTACNEAFNPAVAAIARDYCGNAVTGELLTAGASAGVTLTGATTATTAGGGQAVFSGLGVQGPIGTHTLTISSGNGTQTSATFEITQGLVDALSFSVAPSTTACNAQFNPVVEVTATDFCGNLVTGTSVTLTINGGASLFGTSTVLTDGAGVAIFNGVGLQGLTTGSYTLTAGSVDGPMVTSGSFDITPGTVASLSYVQAPVDTECNTDFDPTVSVLALDFCGNPVPGTTLTVAVAGATLTGSTSAVTNGAGIASFAGLGIQGSTGGYTMDVASNGVLTSATFNITPGTVVALSYTVAPSTTACNALFNPVVEITATDFCGNPVPGTTVSVDISGGASLTGVTSLVTDGAGVAVFNGLGAQGAVGSYTLTATSGSVSQVSNSFDIIPGVADALSFTVQPSTSACGTAFSPVVEVTVWDFCGNLVPSTDVTLSISGGASLTGGPVVVATDFAGVATFFGLMPQGLAGSYTLTATSGSASVVSNSFDISTGAVVSVVYTQAPTTTACNTAFSPAVAVQALDGCGNPVIGTTLTVSVPGLTLTGATTAVTAGGGIATFTGLGVQGAVGSYTMSVSDGAVSTSATFDVVVGTLSSLAFTVEPSTTACNTAFSPTVTVQAADFCGNPVSGATVTVVVPGALLTGTTSVQTDAAGNAVFTGLGIQGLVGSYQMEADWAGTVTTTSNSFEITTGALDNLSYTVQPTDVQCGQDFAPVVQVHAEDFCGNPVAGTTVTLTINGGATLTGTVAVLTDAAGDAYYPGLGALGTVGSYELTATSGPITATSASFNILPGTVASISFAVQPTTTACDTDFSPVVTVTVSDQCGNDVPSTAVTLSISGGATLSGATTVLTDGAGDAVYTGLGVKGTVGTYTLTATAENGLIDVVSTPFEITTGAAAMIAFSAQPGNGVAGNLVIGGTLANTPVVQVYDSCGNAVSLPNVPIQLTFQVNAGGGALYTNPGAGLAFTGPGGAGAWTSMAVDKAGVGYQLRATATLPGGKQVHAISSSFTITHHVANKLAFTVQPSTPNVALQPFATDPVVQVQDFFGNHVTNATNKVTLTIATGVPGAALRSNQYNGSNNQMNAAGGVASFTGVNIDKAGTGYTLGASAPGLAPGFSTGFDIVAGAPAKLAFVTQPSPFNTARAIFATQPVVQVQDAGGNHVTTASFDVEVSLKNPQGTFQIATLFGTVSSATPGGETAYTNLNVDKVGNYQLQATETTGTLTAATSAFFNIDYGPAFKLGFNTQPQTVKLDEPIANVIQLHTEDRGGNLLVGDNDTDVTLSIHPGYNPTGTSLVITNATVTTVAGNASFNDPRILVPSAIPGQPVTYYRLQATGVNVLNQVLQPATSASFIVYPGVATTTTTTVRPATSITLEVCGDTRTMEVIKRDRFGYYTTCGTVNITLNDLGAGAGAQISTTSIAEGVSTASFTYRSGTTAGLNVATISTQINGADIDDTPIAVNQYAGVVNATQATVTALNGTSVEVCGSELGFAIYKRDKNGNPTTRGTITVTLTDNGAGAGVQISSTSAGVSGASPTLTIDDGTQWAWISYRSGTTAGLDVATLNFRVGGTDIVGSPIDIDQYAGVASATRSSISGVTTTVLVGGSTIDFTITKRDKSGNITTRGTVNVSLTDNGTGGASINVATVGEGLSGATVTYTSGTTAGVAIAAINAAIGGTDIVGSPQAITQEADVAVAANSRLTPDAGTRVEVGGSTLDFTITKRDQYGNLTPKGSVDVSLTDNGSGGAGIAPAAIGAGTAIGTVTYTSGTTAGLAVADLHAAIGGTDIQNSPIAIEQYAAPASALTSTIKPQSGTQVEVGGSTLLFDIAKYDAYGNVTTRGTVSLSLTDNGAGAGVAISTTAVGEGQAAGTLTYTSGTTAGVAVATIAAETGGTDILGSPIDIEQYAGIAAAATSRLSGPDKVEVGGSTIDLTVNKRDQYGNATTRGTVSVSLTDNGAGAGVAISTTAVGEGQAAGTVTYTSGTTAGIAVAEVAAAIGGTDIAGSPHAIEQYAATASALTSTVTPATLNLTVGGHTRDLTVTKRDVYGNLTTRGTVSVALVDNGAGAGAQVSPAAIADGQFGGTVTYTSGTTAGIAVAEIHAEIGGTDIVNAPVTVTQVPDAAHHIAVIGASGAAFTLGPPTLAIATRNVSFNAELEVRDQYNNVTTASLSGNLSGSAGATGNFSSGAVTTLTVPVTPQVAGANLTVHFNDVNLGTTTLNITLIYDLLSLSYQTPQNLTRFQPSVTIPANRVGGRPGFSYSFVPGSDPLPAGLTLNPSTGTISGIPTSATVFPLTVDLRVTDFNGTTDDAQIVFTVAPALTIFYPTTNTVFENQLASIPVQTVGGVGPYSYTQVSGSLPSGVTLNPVTGEIAGVPTTTGTFQATIKAVDANGAADNASLMITVVTQANIPTALNLKIALQGPQTGTTSGTIMNNLLNSGGFVPDTDPYNGTVTVPNVPLTAVDWVAVEIRTGQSATTAVASTVAFVRTDGRVTGTDGISEVLFDAADLPAGNYYVVVQHRNHLWVMSAAPVALAPNTSTLYDFTTSQAQAYQQFQDPMAQTGAYGLVTGDAANNGINRGIVNAADRVAVRNASGTVDYVDEDVTLDGIVNAPDRVRVRNNTFRATQVP